MNRTWIVKYWKEVNDEKCDFEEEIEAINIEEAFIKFKRERGVHSRRIESIIEKIK